MQLVKISWHRLACEHTPSVQWIGRRPSAAYGATAKSGPPDLEHVCVQAKFVNGKPDRIEAKYVMRSTLEWDRFMRFMERYAEDSGLGFKKS